MATSSFPHEIPGPVIDALRSAKRVTALTGSGISAESGVPTFRDAQTGLWARYDPQELATPQAFRRNPRLVWQWYNWRRQLIARAAPNPGHYALAKLSQQVPRFVLVTQNIDGLHQQSGCKNVIELHGNITRTKCYEEGVLVDVSPTCDDLPPRCPSCGGWLRPDVAWFGESLPQHALLRALSAARECDLFFSIGTSALVQPAASLATEALHNGATVVEINLEETPLTHYATYTLFGRAGRILPALLKAAFNS